MPEKAHVTSVEAIEDFRTQLILYISKARPALEEVSSDVLRMRLWLENEQRTNLEALVRRRYKELEQAQATLSNARIAVFKHDATAEQLAVTRAKRAHEEAEHKLKRLKYWDREFATLVEPLAKQLEKLHTVLANDMTRATIQLARLIETLSTYADMRPNADASSPSPPSSTDGTSGAGSTGTTNPNSSTEAS